MMESWGLGLSWEIDILILCTVRTCFDRAWSLSGEENYRRFEMDIGKYKDRPIPQTTSDNCLMFILVLVGLILCWWCATIIMYGPG